MDNGLLSPDFVLRLPLKQISVLQLLGVRKVAVLLLLAGGNLLCVAAQPVTVQQLEQMLAAAHGASDVQIAAQLSDLVLIERLSAARLSRYETDFPGPRTRQALMVLSDTSAFLYPPAEETPAIAKPDPKAQREMIVLTVNYVNQTMHQLPNFFANSSYCQFSGQPVI